MNTEVTPNKEELEKLRQAGLGRKKIVFPNKNAGYTAFSEILMEKYPKLRDGGGFQLLRAPGGGGGVRSLDLIMPGQDGYSIPYLRETQCLGQAILYVRPLQANLSMEKQVYLFLQFFCISPLDRFFSAFYILLTAGTVIYRTVNLIYSFKTY